MSGSQGTPRRLLAVDYGATRTGLAATDWTGAICLPLPRLVERDEPKLLQAIAALARERETQAIVVGMPLLVDGSAGDRARRTAAFVERLAALVDPIPVTTIDESHTTDEAHERLKQGGLKAARRKELADSIAALLILERHLAAHR